MKFGGKNKIINKNFILKIKNRFTENVMMNEVVAIMSRSFEMLYYYIKVYIFGFNYKYVPANATYWMVMNSTTT